MTKRINLLDLYGGSKETKTQIIQPKEHDPLFQEKIEKIYKKFKIKNPPNTNRKICYPEKFSLQMPQKFLPEYLSPKTDNKNMLVFHKIGSGKSCTAIRIGEIWKKKRKIILCVPAFLINSIRNEIRSECTNEAYITKEERIKLHELNPKSKEYKNIIIKSNKKIDIHYEIYSYNKFIDGLENKTISLKQKVLIIDEIQNMVSETGKYYKILSNAIDKAPKDLRIILLTATPIYNSILEIPLTLNLLRLDVKFPIGNDFLLKFTETSIKHNKKIIKIKNLNLFKSMIKNRISYFKGALPEAFPVKNLKIIKCEMEEFQYNSYKTVIKHELSKNEQIESDELEDLPNDFFIGSRIISNIAYPNKKTNESGYSSLTKEICRNHEKLKKYSIKFYKILKKIKRCRGTIFIYSNFKEYGGIKALIKVLESNGYKDYQNHHSGKNRFALWSSDQTIDIKDEIRTIFNREDNSDGSKIKIIIGSPSAKEGISFYRVKQVHVLEPYWNQSRLDQVIGRAIRYCSHKDLPKEERVVDVFIYLSTHPKLKKSVDMHIKEIADRKKPITDEFLHAMIEVAVDCKLNYEANKHNGIHKIKCL